MDFHKRFHLVPADGEMVLRGCLDAVRAIGFNDYLCTEVYAEAFGPNERTRRSIEYTRNLLREIEARV